MKIEIRIVEDDKTLRKQRKELSNKFMKGQLPKNTKITLMTTKLFAKVFSPQRMKLLLMMSKEKTNNITSIAKKLDRKFEVVSRDLKLFEQLGFIKLNKEKRSVIPELIGDIKLPTIASV